MRRGAKHGESPGRRTQETAVRVGKLETPRPSPHACDCYPWPHKCPYCNGQPVGTKPEKTASQIIGAFLMMHGVAPWEADELMRWLTKDGFEIRPTTLSFSNGQSGGAA